MRDDNSEWKQEQDEQEQWLDAQTNKELCSLSDEEFFQWIGSIEQKVAKHL